MKSHLIGRLLIYILCMLSVITLIIVIIDPFMHYHMPISPLKAVQWKPEYQVVGMIDHAEYDSLIVGSSVAENYNSRWFDEAYNCKTIKAVREGGLTGDLLYYIDRATDKKELKYIFYSVDIAALVGSCEITVTGKGMPNYMNNSILLDDIQYVWNKDVLLESIPYMIATSLEKDYDEGEAYNWAKWKDFNTFHYEETTVKQDEHLIDYYRDNIIENISNIEERVKNMSDTEFIFIIPPYSYMWWYESYQNGNLEAYIYSVETFFTRILEYDNVRMYYYQTNSAIVENINNYMDTIHFSEDINKYIVDSIIEDKNRITLDNCNQEIIKLREITDKSINELAPAFLEEWHKDR